LVAAAIPTVRNEPCSSLLYWAGLIQCNGQSMKRTIEGMAIAGEPLLRESLEAIKAHRTAQDEGASPEMAERIRLLADSLYGAVVNFQLLEAGKLPDTVN